MVKVIKQNVSESAYTFGAKKDFEKHKTTCQINKGLRTLRMYRMKRCPGRLWSVSSEDYKDHRSLNSVVLFPATKGVAEAPGYTQWKCVLSSPDCRDEITPLKRFPRRLTRVRGQGWEEHGHTQSAHSHFTNLQTILSFSVLSSEK